MTHCPAPLGLRTSENERRTSENERRTSENEPCATERRLRAGAEVCS